jgi:hypothetical protein
VPPAHLPMPAGHLPTLAGADPPIRSTLPPHGGEGRRRAAAPAGPAALAQRVLPAANQAPRGGLRTRAAYCIKQSLATHPVPRCPFDGGNTAAAAWSQSSRLQIAALACGGAPVLIACTVHPDISPRRTADREAARAPCSVQRWRRRPRARRCPRSPRRRPGQRCRPRRTRGTAGGAAQGLGGLRRRSPLQPAYRLQVAPLPSPCHCMSINSAACQPSTAPQGPCPRGAGLHA